MRVWIEMIGVLDKNYGLKGLARIGHTGLLQSPFSNVLIAVNDNLTRILHDY